ncbi:MAG: class II fructose-bisphosphate aldolase [Kiritimatiellaceae bacterium]|nr:class II fructose-bisphosphate aldolase [Kiritimatiellaceae bacterium]
MKFVNAKAMVEAARDGGYAIPAFNANGATYDIARAALEAAQEMKSPLILQSYEPNMEYRGFNYFCIMAGHLMDELNITVPVALHVDHGHTFDSAAKAFQAGFTSFMFDASHDPLDENICKTKKVVELARILGCSVEAEVGYVKGNEPSREKRIGRIAVAEKPSITPAKTDLAEARRFMSEVDVDMLAVSVGTTHGVYQKQTEIDFELLKKLRSALDVPLVQHGTCGISMEDVSKLVQYGMNKVNFGEAFRFNYIKYFNELTDSMEHLWHAWRIMREVKDLLKKDMKEIIRAVGSEGKA